MTEGEFDVAAPDQGDGSELLQYADQLIDASPDIQSEDVDRAARDYLDDIEWNPVQRFIDSCAAGEALHEAEKHAKWILVRRPFTAAPDRLAQVRRWNTALAIADRAREALEASGLMFPAAAADRSAGAV